MVVAVIALFAALCTTSFAQSVARNTIGALQLRSNSVGSSEVRPNAISRSEIRTGGVGSSEVADGSLLAQDFRAGQLPRGATGAQGDRGLTGVQGPQGPQGATGAQGPRGLAGEDGADGDDGDDGADGEDGAPGAPGADGTDAPTRRVEYGVASVFDGTTELGSVWTPDIPDDGTNAGVASGSIVVAGCAQGDVISIRGTVRSAESDGGDAGAGIVITDGDGNLVGGAQTTPPAGGGPATVPVPAVPLISNEPSGDAEGETELVSATVSAPPADGTCIVQGTAQFFDFGDNPTTPEDD